MPDLAAFERWMISRGRGANTAELYAGHLGHCFDQGWKKRLLSGLSPNTKRTILAALRAWAKFTKDADLAAELDDIKLPAPERVTEKTPLERDDWDAICDAVETVTMSDPLRAATRMICVRGFRVGDVCRLEKSQVAQGLETGILNYQAKTGRHLRWGINLYSESLEELMEYSGWRHVWDLLAPRSRKDLRWRAGRLNITRGFPALVKAAGIDSSVTPHRMRRTYAVHYYRASGKDIVALKEHMGWASIQTALRYVDHSRQEELDEIAANMRGNGH